MPYWSYFIVLIIILYNTGTPKNTPEPTKPATLKPTKPWKKPNRPTPRTWTPRPTTPDRLTTTSKSPVVRIPHICRHAKIDAITKLKNGQTYIFQGMLS